MVGTKSPNSADATYLKKVRKPLVEKRRRDRMNNSLAQLKTLLAVSIKQNSDTAMARLDKADILELTVKQLTTLSHQQRSTRLATQVDGYKKGFKDCARETINYLSASQSLDMNSLYQLNNHLQSCYMEKTGRTPNTPHPATVGTVYASTPSEIPTPRDFVHPQSYVINEKMKPPSGTRFGQNNYNVYEQNLYNYSDSVDTSLNSSCNMSLDSSSNVTPEKVVPYQSSDEDVWRPW